MGIKLFLAEAPENTFNSVRLAVVFFVIMFPSYVSIFLELLISRVLIAGLFQQLSLVLLTIDDIKFIKRLIKYAHLKLVFVSQEQ